MFMKTILYSISAKRWLIPLNQFLLLILISNVTLGQLPDCASGNSMYIIYNDSLSGNKVSEIRPVNYATGAVGALMGSTGYTLKRTISGTTYYGSSSLGVDGITGRFFANTSMGFGGGPKDFISINTLTPSTTVIATTPSTSTVNVPNTNGLDDYFFVKMAISPTGTGYAIGVSRDTTITTPAKCNPLISFTTCNGTLAVNCSTIKLLGFLPSTAVSNNWQLYNGDIAFTSTGDLYYLSAAYQHIKAAGRYSDIRLFKILATDIPSAPGSGIIPMSFVADYNSIDSTVLNGLAFDPLGAMYISTKRYNGVQNPPLPTFTNELYKSNSAGSSTIMPGFGPKTLGYAAADLASCYFPAAVLAVNELRLSGSFNNGSARLTWKVNNDTQFDYFEIQRSDDGSDFATIGRINSQSAGQGNQPYSYDDVQVGFGNAKFYRIRQVTEQGARFYSNITKINFSSRIQSVSKAMPNPFSSAITINVELKAEANISLRLTDNAGRLVALKNYKGNTGMNKLNLDKLAALQPGLYILETMVNEETIREKIIKQ